MSLQLKSFTDTVNCDGTNPAYIGIGGAGVRWHCTISEATDPGTAQLYQRSATVRPGEGYTYGSWVASPLAALTIGVSGNAAFVWTTADDMQYALLTDPTMEFELACSPTGPPREVINLSGGADVAGAGLIFASPTEDDDGNLTITDGTTSTKVSYVP